MASEGLWFLHLSKTGNQEMTLHILHQTNSSLDDDAKRGIAFLCALLSNGSSTSRHMSPFFHKPQQYYKKSLFVREKSVRNRSGKPLFY